MKIAASSELFIQKRSIHFYGVALLNTHALNVIKVTKESETFGMRKLVALGWPAVSGWGHLTSGVLDGYLNAPIQWTYEK